MDTFENLFSTAADIVWYNTIRSYISTRIDYFLEHTLSNALTIVGAIAMIVMTIWIMIQGYLIVTGRSQEGLKGFIFKTARAYFIVLFATGLAAGQGFSVRTLTDDLMSSVSQMMTGNKDAAKCLQTDAAFLGCKVDRGLQVMQASMTFIGQIDTADDPILEDKKVRAGYFAGIGTAGPAIIVGSMILMYKIMIALFIGLGPIFILCLLFKQTAPLFQKWLYYGISTIFASTLLAVMADISLDLVMNIAKGLFVASIFTNQSGVMQAATQQLGLGLLLSTLLITVPPMAAQFFNGVMGQYNSMNTMAGWGGSPAAAQQGAMGAQGGAGANGQTTSGAPVTAPSQAPPTTAAIGPRASTGQTAQNYSADVVKSSEQSQTGNAARSYTPPETPPPVAPEVRSSISTAPKES